MRGPSLLALIGDAIARYLTGASRAPYSNAPTDIERFRLVVQAGDVVLVDGRQRISTAIKYLTQSTWSHAALCIGNFGWGPGEGPHFIEADAVEGVRVISASRLAEHHLRICRPVGLTAAEIDAVCICAINQIGHEYDLRNVVDLARYLFPTPPVPAAWRRRMIALGSGEPTKAICSSLIAQAFQSVRYPILPVITQVMSEDPNCRGCFRDLLHIRHHSLFTPRDFDVSPYFEIIKPTLTQEFDHKNLVWGDKIGTTESRQQQPASV